MNHDSLPSSSRASLSPNDVPSGSAANNSDEQGTKKRLQLEKRAVFLDHLILNLDLMIYLQFSVLYYMDPSMLFLLFRLIPQWIYLTPKSPLLPPFPVTSRPYLLFFFLLNLLYLLMHLTLEPAAAGEATRGYLHGGIIIDFIGQLSPVSKIKLVATDLIIWALQTIMLAVSLERRKLAGSSNETAAAGASSGVTEGEAESWHNHDAAERGELSGINPAESQDIELQPLHWDQASGEEVGNGPPDDPTFNHMEHHPLDIFHSGQHIIAYLDLANMIRTQWLERNIFRIDTSQSMDAQRNPSLGAVATLMAGSNLSFRLRAGGGQPLGEQD